MAQVVIDAALGIDGHLIVGKTARSHSRRVDDGDHRIRCNGVAQCRPLKGLHQRLGQCRWLRGQ